MNRTVGWSSIGVAIALAGVGILVGSWQRVSGDLARAFGAIGAEVVPVTAHRAPAAQRGAD